MNFYSGENINKLHPHDALFDIKASIAEMSFYMKNLHQNAKKQVDLLFLKIKFFC